MLDVLTESFKRECAAKALSSVVNIALVLGKVDGDGMICDENLQRYFLEVAMLRNFICDEVNSIVCIDEDVSPPAGTSGFHIAGSGELEAIVSCDLEQIVGRISWKVLNAYSREGIKIKEVTKHEDCGAGKQAFEGDSQSTHACHDTYAISTVPLLAQRLTDWIDRSADIPSNDKWGVQSRFVTLQDMGYADSFRKFHSAALVTYDGTGMVNLKNNSSLPKNFQISRRHMRRESAERDTEVACSIAFGARGLASLGYFTKERPLVLFGVADSKNSKFGRDTLDRELREILRKVNTVNTPTVATVVEL